MTGFLHLRLREKFAQGQIAQGGQERSDDRTFAPQNGKRFATAKQGKHELPQAVHGILNLAQILNNTE